VRRNYGDDGRSEVITDGTNFYLASCTRSTDFPTTANALKKNLGGDQDGVFIKTNNDLSIVYNCTYIGGDSTDATFVLALNPLNNNIYIAGGTASKTLQATGGSSGTIVLNSFGGGECDGFISIINASTFALQKSCFVGTKRQ